MLARFLSFFLLRMGQQRVPADQVAMNSACRALARRDFVRRLAPRVCSFTSLPCVCGRLLSPKAKSETPEISDSVLREARANVWHCGSAAWISGFAKNEP